MHHDLWDYDVPAQPSLVDLTIGGQTRPGARAADQAGRALRARPAHRRAGPAGHREVPRRRAPPQGDHTAPTQPVSALSFDPPPLTGADMWGATMFDQLACRIAVPARCATRAASRRRRCRARWSIPATSASSTGAASRSTRAADRLHDADLSGLRLAARARADDTTLYVQGEQPARRQPAGAQRELRRALRGQARAFAVAARHALPGAALGPGQTG